VRNTRNSRNQPEDTVALWQRPLIWAGNCLLARPRDSLLSIGAATAVGAIIINGLYLQPGPHPAPIFAFKPAHVTADVSTGAVSGTLPRPRPAEPQIESRVQQQIQTAPPRPQVAAASRRDPIADLLASTAPHPSANSVASNHTPVPPAPIPAPSSSGQLRTIQQRLGEFGYGPVKANGVDGPETRTAIERFERAHNLPVTGKVSERLKTELVNMTGPL
jgi:hypothetical protein